MHILVLKGLWLLMWEITLVGEKSDYVYFSLLDKELRDIAGTNLITAMTIMDKICYSVAIKEKKYINFVKNAIFELIIKINKEEYFKEKLIFKNNINGLNHFIITSLVFINLQEEIDYARVIVKLSKTVFIRSLMMFKLNKLYKIWDKLICFFNLNLMYKSENEISLEFLKLLANNIQSRTEIMYLDIIKDNMCIFDKNKNLISCTPEEDEIGVIVNLITYAPKKIIINCYDHLSSKVTELIKYIFDDKCSFII